ncbi:MAG: hypothetical protein R3C52_01115 [Hyphomonadaceae bacterium]
MKPWSAIRGSAILGSAIRGLVAGAMLLLAPVLAAGPVQAQVADVPFHISDGGHVVIPVTVNGEAGEAILDNGVPFTTLDAGFSDRIGLKPLLTVGGAAMWALSGRRMVEEITLGVGPLREKVEPALMDLSVAEEADEGDLLGIVGGEIFRRYTVEVDFDARRVRFYDHGAFKPPAGAMMYEVKNAYRTGKLFLPIQVEGGKTVSAMLDFGMPGALVLAKRAAPDHWEAEGRAWKAGELGTATRGETFQPQATRLTPANEVTLFDHAMKDVPVVIGDVGVAGVNFPAILGTQILRRFNLAMDITTGRIWLTPSRGYDKPFSPW